MKQVCVRAGVSKSELYEVMSGAKHPTVVWLRKLAEGLECEVIDLISGDAPLLPATPRLRERDRVPLLSLRAAAGAFLEAENVKAKGYVRVPPPRMATDQMFAAVVIGRSMEPEIESGAICLFRLLEGRDPDGKVLLLQLRDARDPETGGRYTVKRFKVVKRRGDRILEVRLEPANRAFRPMVLNEDPMRELTPIAELLEVVVAPE